MLVQSTLSKVEYVRLPLSIRMRSTMCPPLKKIPRRASIRKVVDEWAKIKIMLRSGTCNFSMIQDRLREEEVILFQLVLHT